jgi:hypothetical protein
MSIRREEDTLTPEEATKHARRGGCLMLLLLPFICYCTIWPLLSWTPRGRMITAYAVLYYTYNGLPISFKYADGFPDIARAGCELDRQSPRPGNYQQLQASLEADYDTFFGLYRTYFSVLEKERGDTSQYEPPSDIPGNFASAKLYYCRR